MTTYFVSGYMRTGTSMMMCALEAGGMDAAKNTQRDEYLLKRFGDDRFHPNAGGFYELNMRQYTQDGFPRMYGGMLIKLLWGALPLVVAGDYKVVFMRREYDEVAESYDATFGESIPHPRVQFMGLMNDALGVLEVRRDMDVTVVNYQDVLDDPLDVFTRLVANDWPIDPVAAAAIVDPAQHRFEVVA